MTGARSERYRDLCVRLPADGDAASALLREALAEGASRGWKLISAIKGPEADALLVTWDTSGPSPGEALAETHQNGSHGPIEGRTWGHPPFFATGLPARPLRAPPAPAASVPTSARWTANGGLGRGENSAAAGIASEVRSAPVQTSQDRPERGREHKNGPTPPPRSVGPPRAHCPKRCVPRPCILRAILAGGARRSPADT
jgi:hypothetical protein